MHRSGRRALLSAATVTATTAALLFGGVTTASAAPDPSLDTGVLRTVTRNADVGFPTGQKVGRPADVEHAQLAPEPKEGEGAQDLAGAARISPAGAPVVQP